MKSLIMISTQFFLSRVSQPIISRYSAASPSRSGKNIWLIQHAAIPPTSVWDHFHHNHLCTWPSLSVLVVHVSITELDLTSSQLTQQLSSGVAHHSVLHIQLHCICECKPT